MSDAASRLAAQQHRNGVLEDMVQEAEGRRKEEMEGSAARYSQLEGMVQDAEGRRQEEMKRSAARYSQLETDTQSLLHEHTTRSKRIEESMKSSLEEERQRVSDAEAKTEAAMQKIIELKAEASQREAKMAALEAEVRRLADNDRYVHSAPWSLEEHFSLRRLKLSKFI